MTPEQRAAVVLEARSWLGTPYVHTGRIKGVGVDCAQLLIAVFAAAGVIEEFDPGHYTHDWYMNQSEELYLGHLMRYAVRTEDPQPGDIAVYAFGKCVSHGGIIVEPGYMVHAFRPHGRVDLMELRSLETRWRGYWTVQS